MMVLAISGNVFPMNVSYSLQTKNHLSCKQNQTLQSKTLSVVHFSAFVGQRYSSIWSLPGETDFWGQLSFKTTTKMWHFSYLKQNNHRSCQLALRKQLSFLLKDSRYNWRFKFQFPHSSSTTLATYQKWSLICLYIFNTETYKIRRTTCLFTNISEACYLLKLGLNVEA